MGVNGGAMPVMVQGCASAIGADDPGHICATAQTHLKILGDWLIYNSLVGVQAKSIGDIFLEIGLDAKDVCQIVWAALILRDYNKPT
jgi:hypothetical protein